MSASSQRCLQSCSARRGYRRGLLSASLPRNFAAVQDLKADNRALSRKKKNRTNCPRATVGIDAKVCITLRLLAGASYLDVGWAYEVGKTSPNAIFRGTLHALNCVLPNLTFPTSEADCAHHARLFHHTRRSPISGIIAALDGIAISIRQPKLSAAPDPRKYYNRKGFYAICVQAAVSADYKFLFISARHTGATHDSTAFQGTQLHTLLESNVVPNWATIAADDAYSNSKHVLTPYSGNNLTQAQDSFNFYLSSCRIAVEQSFGILVSRFGIFWSPLRYDLSICTLIIMVAAKMHNVLVDSSANSSFSIPTNADENYDSGAPVVHLQDMLHTEQDVQRSRQRQRERTDVRDRIANMLSTLGYIRPRRA